MRTATRGERWANRGSPGGDPGSTNGGGGRVLTSAVVLGSTVAGMQPRDEAGMQVIALERVTVTAPRIN